MPFERTSEINCPVPCIPITFPLILPHSLYCINTFSMRGGWGLCLFLHVKKILEGVDPKYRKYYYKGIDNLKEDDEKRKEGTDFSLSLLEFEC